MTAEIPMLDVHARRSARDWREADLHLARLREVGLVLPFQGDLPGHHESARRLPGQDAAPVAVGTGHLLGVAAATHPALDDALLHRRLADVVLARPPAVQLRGEHLERTLHARLHG